MEINGVAHIFVTAGDFERSKAFYMKLLPFLGLKEVMNAAGVYYAVGGRTGFAVRAPSPDHIGERFVQNRVGLHHVCFRARSPPGCAPSLPTACKTSRDRGSRNLSSKLCKPVLCS